ncbi:MAG TPA: DUF2723 domain-containing protein [Gemmatimonadaceae bacterium]
MPRPSAAPVLGAYRPSYGAAAIAAVLVLLLYIVTLAPTTAMWDASEYIAAVKVLGLPHPPGNPLFVLIGHTFGLLPIAPEYAQRINLLAALCSALSAGIWFLVAERALAGFGIARPFRLAGAAVATLVGATAFTVWNQSVVNEKVYTVALLFVAVVSWLMIRWLDEPEGPRSDHILVAVAYLLGLGYTNHPAGFLALPAVGIAVLVRRPTTLLRWRLVAAGAAALLLGLTPFIYEPIRAAHFPRISLGEPTACTTGLALECTLDPVTADRLVSNINREQYGKNPVTVRQAPIGAQIGMWWMYFEWQWLRDADGNVPGLQRALAFVFLALGLYGGVLHWQRDRRTFWYVGTLVFTVTLGLIYYLNFKYGFSQAPELGDAVPREVRDRDYFYLWSFSTWGIWAGLGLVGIWQLVAGATTGAAPAERRRFVLSSPVLAFALVPLIVNWGDASRAGETFTREWAHDLLNSVEPYGVLITNGDNDTFPLWYAQEVEGVRQDVTVLVTSLLGTDWNVRQLVRNPVRPYDAATGPSIYRDREWPTPTGSPLALSMEAAEAIPDYTELREAARFRAGNIDAIVPPQLLTRDKIVTLQMIRSSFPSRAIYFSASVYPEELGLSDYIVRQGLALRLWNGLPSSAPGTVPTATGHLDVPRTLALWTDVYRGPEALLEQDDWVDRASISIPLQYVFAGGLLAEGLDRTGRDSLATEVSQKVRAIADAVDLSEIFGP